MVSHSLASSSSVFPPIALTPTLFIGIDVGKKAHIAGFVSASILKQSRFEKCPVLRFEQNRAGLLAFLARVKTFVPSPRHAAILLEATGHYHRPLWEALIAEGFRVYVVAIHTKRVVSRNKTDVHDARRLAHSLYAQLALDLQIEEKSQQVRQLVPATDVAQQLHGLMRRHYEVTQTSTRLKNKLIAINDELFPEFSEVFKDPCAEVALDIRSRFPTPAILAATSLEALRVVRRRNGPSNAKLTRLQTAAKRSIGVTNVARVNALTFEQEQLIDCIRLTQQQCDVLETKIEELVASSREGRILLSFDSMQSIHAGTLIAMIGNIRNFPRKCEFRKYCGWAPRSTQTGTSVDRVEQTPTGSHLLKRSLYLLTIGAISHENTVWGALYYRLLPLKCPYDARIKDYKGKMRVIGRVAGQMAGVIYTLLKADADLVDALAEGQELPAPQLYDPEIHAGTKATPERLTATQ